jgi:hypothetical protein
MAQACLVLPLMSIRWKLNPAPGIAKLASERANYGVEAQTALDGERRLSPCSVPNRDFPLLKKL